VNSLRKPAGAEVEIGVPGVYGNLTPLTPTPVPEGTPITSYYLHTFGPDIAGNVFAGSITFSTPILGLLVTAGSLLDSNGLLGVPTTVYPSGGTGFGFDFGSGQLDSVTISADRLTLTFATETFTAADDLRIITAADVPEPATLGLTALGLGAMVRRYRRRRADAR